MMKLFILVLLSLLLCASACAPAKYCDRPDMGTCGNACCTLEFRIDEDPTTIALALNATMHDNGVDNLFTWQNTAEGTLGMVCLDERDLTPKSPVCLGKVNHLTQSHTYTDSIWITVNWPDQYSTKNGSIVKLHSQSLLGGALGDSSQNYANNMLVMDSLNMGYTQVGEAHGCPKPSQ
jgi:hypothetical protein